MIALPKRDASKNVVFAFIVLFADPCLGFWCMDCSLAMQMLSSTGISTLIFTSLIL